MVERGRSKHKVRATAQNRRTINRIKSLKDKDGLNVEWGSGLVNIMVEYFENLFEASNAE